MIRNSPQPLVVGDLVTQGHLWGGVSKDRDTALLFGSAAAELSVPVPMLPAPLGDRSI